MKTNTLNNITKQKGNLIVSDVFVLFEDVESWDIIKKWFCMLFGSCNATRTYIVSQRDL